jgi:hypothetical protein
MKTPWNLVFVVYLILMIVTIFKIGDPYFLVVSVIAAVYILKKFEGARKEVGAGNAFVLLGLMLLPLPAFLLGGKDNALRIVATVFIAFGLYAIVRHIFRMKSPGIYGWLAEKANKLITPLDETLFVKKE